MQPWFTTPPFFHILDFTPRETRHAIRFEKDTRYYVMHLEKDLLDDWIIKVINGRIQTKLGQLRTLAFPCFADAFVAMCDMTGVRLKRGYRLKTWQSDDISLLQFFPFATINTNSTTLKKLGNTRKKVIQKPSSSPETFIQQIPKQMAFEF